VSTAGRPTEFSGLVLVVVMIVVVIVIVVAMAPAFALCSFEFLMALMGLSTVFAVTLNGVTQFFFGLVDAPFAFIVAIGACRHRRGHEPCNEQEGNAKILDATSHGFSFNRKFYREATKAATG